MGETVKAVVVPAEGATPDEAALIAFIRSRVGHYKCPISVSMVSALPRNPTGKLLKRQLRLSFTEPNSVSAAIHRLSDHGPGLASHISDVRRVAPVI